MRNVNWPDFEAEQPARSSEAGPAPATQPGDRGEGGWARGKPISPAFGMAAIAVALAGCANARVTSVASVVPAAGPAPVEILVDVAAAPDLARDPAQADAVGEVTTKLRFELIDRLTKDRITAEPFMPAARHPGAAVLHVAISKADPGNRAERLVIGFGLGRAELQVTAGLQSSDGADAAPLTTFTTAGNSGYKPGLIAPLGVYAATRDISHLVIGGGLKLATGLDDGLDKPVAKTASAVVGQLKTYYVSVGWYWPAGV